MHKYIIKELNKAPIGIRYLNSGKIRGRVVIDILYLNNDVTLVVNPTNQTLAIEYIKDDLSIIDVITILRRLNIDYIVLNNTPLGYKTKYKNKV